MRSASRARCSRVAARPSSSANRPSGWRSCCKRFSSTPRGSSTRRARCASGPSEAPATAGTIDGKPFAWIADADTRLGPMLEAIMNGKNYWLPFARLAEIKIEKPIDLRDVAWMPAVLTFTTGGESVAFVPTRYPGLGGGGRSQHRDGAQHGLERAGARRSSRPRAAPAGHRRGGVPADGRPGGEAGRAVRFRRRLIHGRADAKRAPAAVALGSAHRRQPGNRVRSRATRGILSPSRLRECVRRDLTWLLNTTHLAALQDLSEQPEVQRSVLNYGMPGLRGADHLDSVDIRAMEKLIAVSSPTSSLACSRARSRFGWSPTPEKMSHNAMCFRDRGGALGAAACRCGFFSAPRSISRAGPPRW